MVACYIRVSTENQLENYSIEEQSERLKAYCKAKGYDNPKLYTDGGYSGGNLNRPALQKMLSDIHNGLISMVIVYKLDRLSRSQKDTLLLIEDEFLKNNVDFTSVCENFDTSTPFGRAMIGILSVFAQLEKDQITERFTMGRIGRAKEGLFHGGAYAPTGYDYKDGKLVVNEYEAMQVREAYKLFLDGHNINSIYKHMNSTYTTKYGSWNSDTLVRTVLTNKIYIGIIKFKGQEYKGQHEPIIDDDTFYKVQELISKKQSKEIPFKAKTLLSGLIYCKQCGAKYHGEHGNYSCYSRTKGDSKRVIDPNCKNKKFRIDELDNIVIDYLRNIDFENIKTNNVKNNADTIQLRINEIDNQIQRMIDLYQIGSISIDSIKQRTEKLNKEKEMLQQKLQGQLVKHSLTCEEASLLVYKLLGLIESGSLIEKRSILSKLIKRVEIDNNDVAIFLNI